MKSQPLRSLLVLSLLLLTSAANGQEGKHLFILSGQSNMQGHRPDEAFTPAVQEAFGTDQVIVIQDALGGQPIQRWYKAWKDPQGQSPKTRGDLYDRLMAKVQPAIADKTIESVTFIWMQGERDAKMQWASVYEKSLRGLHQQLSNDLGRDDVGFIIGRLSDFDMQNRRYPDWTEIREIQVKVADSAPDFAWVNTDDLNDGINRAGKKIQNDLHYSGEGYKELGRRFASTALKLIRSK
ncbi:MAG: sialate O-acetylesterase [Planctomycetota bacterium]|nr:sialate O-acetylesterase [Planctomycetota bacterium]